MNAITTQERGAMALSEPELLDVLSSSLYPGASHASIKLVLGYCKAAGFDPMQKPVHIVPMWDGKAGAMRDVVMPGVGLYRTQAARGGCAGVSEPEFGPDVTDNIGGQDITFPLWCRVTVKRRQAGGQVDEFTAREFWRENYAVRGGKERSIAPNAMWTKRPYGQLAKCAEAQALRKAFPEIGSAPAAEEMEGKAIDHIDAPETSATRHMGPATVVPPTWPDNLFATQFTRWSKAVQAGLKTHDDIVTMALAKGSLTDAQHAQIMAIIIPQAAPPQTAGDAADGIDAAELAAGEHA